MLIRDLKRFVVLVVPLFTAIFLTLRLIRKHTHPHLYYQHDKGPEWLRHQPASRPPPASHDDHPPRQKEQQRPPAPPPPPVNPPPNLQLDQHDPTKLAAGGGGSNADPFEGGSEAAPLGHLEVSSAGLGGSSKRYFTIQFADRPTINPNILPHPSLPDTFVVVAQEHPTPPGTEGHFNEIVCNARFRRGVLGCVSFPIALSIAPTTTAENRCNDPLEPKYAMLELNVGPHDARVFYGPRGVPFIVYGSNSGYTCFGQWIQDFRVPARWESDPLAISGPQPTTTSVGDPLTPPTATPSPTAASSEAFQNGTEMRRPQQGGGSTAPPSLVEKNWFVFWDRQGGMYTHHDMHPRRSFALLGPSGAALGADLAPETAEADARCMAAFMPQLLPQNPAHAGRPDSEPDTIHQSTNSLSVTLCHRSDPACEAMPGNTFVFVIVHRKSFRGFRSAYEPHAVLFRQSAPFGLHAVSTMPIWIKGRRSILPPPPDPLAGVDMERDQDRSEKEPRHEMFYVTSISWAGADKRYHGFLDDTLFLGFGIEDKRSGGIDVVAGDLLKALGLCEDLHG